MRHARLRGLILIVAAACVASATTIVPLSVEQLAGKSTYVLRARAVQTWAAWNPQHTLIYTYTKFQVTQSLKGIPGQTVIVKQIGGRVGNTVQKVAGVQHFVPGEEDFLFLQPSRQNDGTLLVTGLMQGHYQVQRSASGQTVVSNGLPEVSAMQAGSSGLSSYRGSAMSVRELEKRVQKVVQR